MTKKTDGGQVKWYLKPLVVFVFILMAGPFALGLVWMSPAFKRWHKAAITLLVLAITIWLVKSGVELYGILLKELKSLSEIR